MQEVPRSLTDTEAKSLAEFLGSTKRPEGTLLFHQLQGFLFAIACSPETIPTSDWLPLIFDDEDPEFDGEEEAQRFLNNVMALFNEVNRRALNRSEDLARECLFYDDLLANFGNKASISQWSQGFLVGHDWLSEIWEQYLIDEMDEECGATVMVLSFFSSREIAEVYFADSNPHKTRSKSAFEDFAGKIRELFPKAMASYAHMGRTIFEFLLDREDDQGPRH